MFDVLVNLRVINLSNNHITSIHPSTFAFNLNLHTLILSNNWMGDLDADAFPLRSPTSLMQLHIDNNGFSYMTEELLRRLHGLKYIRLAGNPWKCSCYDQVLRWIHENVVTTICDDDYHSGDRPMCYMPTNRSNNYCTYRYDPVDLVDREKYLEINKSYPPSPHCSIISSIPQWYTVSFVTLAYLLR